MSSLSCTSLRSCSDSSSLSRGPWLALLPSGVVLLWLTSWASWFWNHNPELNFGWVVLLLSAYLLWEAWQQRPTAQLHWSPASVGFCLAGLAALFYAQLYRVAFGVTTEGMSVLGFGAMLLVAGNLHFVFGWPGVKLFAFGLVFFLLALPIPDTVHYPLVSSLQSQVAAVNVELLNLVGIPASRTGNAIRLPTCVVGIDEACSGIRSLQSAVMATLFIAHLTLKRSGLRVSLLFAGLAFALGGNLIRSFLLSWIAHTRGVQATEAFHDAAGWSILVFTLAGVAVSAWLFSRLEKVLDRTALPSSRAAAGKS